MNAPTGTRNSISASDLLRDIKATMAEIEAKAPQQPSIFGEAIFISPYLDDMPKMQLTPKVYDNLPAPFRDEMNAWMREFFGTESRMYHTPGVGIFMGPKMLEQVKAHAG